MIHATRTSLIPPGPVMPTLAVSESDKSSIVASKLLMPSSIIRSMIARASAGNSRAALDLPIVMSSSPASDDPADDCSEVEACESVETDDSAMDRSSRDRPDIDGK
jgi:hypothetical protein